MRARGSTGSGGAGSGMYVDPLEWARRRQAALEHATRLREERALGGPLDESYTFTPQINKAPTQQLALARARTQQRAVASRRRSQHQQLQRQQLQRQQQPTARDGFLLPAASRSGSVASIASSSSSSSSGADMPPSLCRAVGASSLSAASSFALATVAPVQQHTRAHRPQATTATAATTTTTTALAVAQHMTATVASMRRSNSGGSSTSSTSSSNSRKAPSGWGNSGGSGAEAPMLVPSPRRGLPPSLHASQEEATVGLGAGQTSAFAKSKRSASLSSSGSGSGAGSSGVASLRKERGAQRAKEQPPQSPPQQQKPEAPVAASKPAWVSHWEGQASPAAPPAVVRSPSSSLALLKAKLSRGKARQPWHGGIAALESGAESEDERGAIRAAEGRGDASWERKGSGGKEKEAAASGAGRPLWVDDHDEWYDAVEAAEEGWERKAAAAGVPSSSPVRKGPRRLRRRWSSGPYHDMDLGEGPSAAAQEQHHEEEEQQHAPPPRSVVAAGKRRPQQQEGPPSRFALGGGGAGASLIPCDGCGRAFNERAFQVHSKICRDVFQSRRAVFDSRRKRLAGTEAGKYHASSVAAQARSLPPRKRQGAKSKPKPVAGPAAVAAAAVESLRLLKRQQPKAKAAAAAMAYHHHHHHHEEEEDEDDETTSQAGFRSLSTNSSASSLGLKQQMHQGQGEKPFPATLEALATPQWKQQSEAFRGMLRRNRAISRAEREGRDISSPAFLASLPPAGPEPTTEALVPCPHCGRRFAQTTAERHVPKCADIQHKPTTLRRGGGMGLGKAAREKGPAGAKGFSVRL